MIRKKWTNGSTPLAVVAPSPLLEIDRVGHFDPEERCNMLSET